MTEIYANLKHKTMKNNLIGLFSLVLFACTTQAQISFMDYVEWRYEVGILYPLALCAVELLVSLYLYCMARKYSRLAETEDEDGDGAYNRLN